METSEVRAIVETHASAMLHLVGAPHWKVEIEYGRCDNPEWGAQCYRKVEYWHAIITLDPERHDTEQDVLDSLRHEMTHLLLAPFDLYRDLMTQHISVDSPEGRQEGVAWTFAVEQTVRAISASLPTLEAPGKRKGKS